MRNLLLSALFLFIGCSANKKILYKQYWLCTSGYCIGEKYAGSDQSKDRIGFCRKDCPEHDIKNLRVDEDFNVYLDSINLGRVVSCNENELVIVSTDDSVKGYYINDGEK